MELIQEFCRLKALPPSFESTAESYYLPLLNYLVNTSDKATLTLGINGAQGSGKSTLADFLAFAANRLYGWNVSYLSIDDIYHTKAVRLDLSQKVHPLLETRGVPGTHDVDLGALMLTKLCELKSEEALLLPKFDKALDDRLPESEWSMAKGKQDLVIFEGWCVGCDTQNKQDLQKPINNLESEQDTDCLWRTYVNSKIAEYADKLWSRLDTLVMLRVPSFEQVYQWRTEQESKLVESLGYETELSDPEKMKYFISHYERLTRHMLNTLGETADVVMDLNKDHAVYKIQPDIVRNT